MKHRILWVFTALLMLLSLPGCAKQPAPTTDELSTSNASDESNDIMEFRPVDCGVQTQALYQYPFMGMEIELSETLREKLDSREVFAFTLENYVDESTIDYAFLRFSVTTEAQRTESGMSVDIFSWEEALEKLGAIGVYRKERVSELDMLTQCDTHKKLGESTDGNYEYYLSTKGDSALTKELAASQVFLTEMHALDMNLGYSAFSMDREQGIDTVGTFRTTDVFGGEYTQEMFAEYDLTLVNAFATWCSPCVNEMPELEGLRAAYAKKGIKLGVVAVVLDAKLADGTTDEAAVENAQTLSKKSGAQFPFLIPDETNMNGRLTGIASVPESFFVDQNGNIVSDPIIGANSQEGWSALVDEAFEALS